MTDNSIDPWEAAQRDCEAAEQHVSDCRDALERAERVVLASQSEVCMWERLRRMPSVII